MTKLLIQVTEEDIRLGKPAHFNKCPVARAIKRVVSTNDVSVGSSNVSIDDQLILLPLAVEEFIYDFDTDEEVHPMSFEIEVVDVRPN